MARKENALPKNANKSLIKDSKNDFTQHTEGPRAEQSPQKNRAGKFPWIAIWLLMLLIAIGFGVATRASYVDFSSNNSELMALQYRYIPYSIDNIAMHEEGAGVNLRDPESLIGDAGIIIECEFTGDRTYSYLAFRSQVKVSRVLKGSDDLLESLIYMYEPMKISNNDFYYISAQDAYCYGGTLMSESGRYILFLNERIYAEEAKVKETEYVLSDSPFSKLKQAQDGEAYIGSQEYIELLESTSYEILAENEASARDYLATKSQILHSLANL